MKELSVRQLLSRIEELEGRLEESEQLINAIRSGEVDAFAITKEDEHEVYTLESGDYAYRVLIEGLQEGAINVTDDGLTVYTNPYFYGLLNLPYEKVIGNPIYNFIHPDSLLEFRRLFTGSLSGNIKGEVNLAISGAIIPVYISLTSLRPKLDTIGIVITDLSEKKKNEKVILAYQKSLEENNVELLKTNTELASFSYIASHDLQEPLRKIQMFSTRILQKEYDNMTESGKDHFLRMQNAAKRMQDLIEDLLTYSRTNSVDRNFEKTDLNGLIEDVEAGLKEELQQKKAVILRKGKASADIIPFQFRQVLTNLVSNSLKLSVPEIPPVIRIESEIVLGNPMLHDNSVDRTAYCHVSLEDNGIGFEQQYAERIFELFQRLHGVAQYKGTGIGLAIVKKIIDNHNGFIYASSTVNQGAKFDIYIPVIQKNQGKTKLIFINK